MLKGKEILEKVNKIGEDELQECTYAINNEYSSENNIKFKVSDNTYISIKTLSYYCNNYLNLEEDTNVPISTLEDEIKIRIKELESTKKEILQSIEEDIREIEELLNRKIKVLKKKAIIQYAIKSQLTPLKEAQSVKEFNIADKVIENKNQWIKGEDKSYFIKNEVFKFRYRIDEHWSYRSDVPKVDIAYSLYVNIKGKDYNITDVKTVKLESEKDIYIEKLKSRFAKYFKYEEPTIDKKIIETLIEKYFRDYSFEELKDRLITMNYNVVKKL